MLTLALQALVALTALAVGIAALRAVRPPGEGAEAWLLTGTAFTLLGASGLLQNGGAVRAFLAGPGAPAYESYLRWAPAWNHGRGVLMVGFALLLLGLVVRRGASPRRFRVPSAAALMGCMALGMLLGWMEGAFLTARHYPVVAILNAGVLLPLLAALLLGLTHTLDRLLWLLLGLYALKNALHTLWISARAGFDSPGAWYPSGRAMLVISTLIYLAMLALALRRGRAERLGRPVPPLAAVAPVRTVLP